MKPSVEAATKYWVRLILGYSHLAPTAASGRDRMREGLTGGIASGKSTVTALLRELGAVVIDADQLAREVVAAGTPGLAAVVEEFGPEVLTPEGEMDRAAVGRMVFSDDAARRRLEGIIHPLVFEETQR